MSVEDRARYDRAARKASGTIIDSYSTSFGRAARLLSEPVRTHVRSIYGLVRLADEIVDGAFDEATSSEQGTLLDELERETLRAVHRGFSTNVAVHAFALTARIHAIGDELIEPFFSSMRTDLVRAEHDDASLAEYVHGSAEVVGLMCLRVFLGRQPRGGTPSGEQRYAALADGAKALGSAFQKVNFLRDLAADRIELGRTYFPGVSARELTDEQKDELLDGIEADLEVARGAIVCLPPSSRRGVLAAHGLFAELVRRMRRTSAVTIRHKRVRVPAPAKARVLAKAVLDDVRMSRRRPDSPANARGRAVVIGAGIAGLASAALLAQDGYDVEVLERRPTTGGRCGSWQRDGFRFDTGPSWYLMPEVFEHFFRLCGTSAEQELALGRLDPAYRVFFEGDDQPIDVRSGLDEATALFESLEPGAGEALTTYLDSARSVYELAVKRFLFTSFASFRPLLRPDVLLRAGDLVRLLLESLERRIARDFHNPRLRQILGYPAVFLGTSPDRAPSMYHLMSHMDLADGVLYPRGGLATVTEAIERIAVRAGARITTGAEVTAVHSTPGPLGRGRRTTRRAAAHVSEVEVREGDTTRRIPADVVVGAGDLHHLETQLLPDHLRTYPERWWSRRDPGPGAVLIFLGIRGRLDELSHHNLLFTRNWTANFDAIYGRNKHVPDPASLYVSAPSRTDPGAAPAGHENLFVLVPVPADPALGRGGDDGDGDAVVERIADAAIAQIATWTGVDDLAERVVVRRTVGPGDFESDFLSWSGGALGPAHTLRQSAMFRGRNASRHIDGLVYAGASTIPGVGLPMCLISAEIALKRLRGDTSTPPLPEPAQTTARAQEST